MSQPWLRTAFKTLGWNFPNEDIHLLLKVIPDVFNFCIEQINRLSSARQLGLCSRTYRNVNVRFTWPKYRMARLKSFCESTLFSSHGIRITLVFFKYRGQLLLSILCGSFIKNKHVWFKPLFQLWQTRESNYFLACFDPEMSRFRFCVIT